MTSHLSAFNGRKIGRPVALLAAAITLIAVCAIIGVIDSGIRTAGTTAAAASFPATTRVLTPDGPATIGTLRAGQAVLSYNPSTGTVEEATIIEITSRSYNGQLISVIAGGETVRATSRHAFWVVAGADLHGRSEAPGGDEPLSSEGRWVAAESVRRGDVLLSVGGQSAVTEVGTEPMSGSVYDVRLTGIGALAVGSGVFASDVRRDTPPSPSVSSGGRGGCFVGGTLVLAAHGAVPIEQIVAGDQVWAWDPIRNEWQLRQVEKLLTHEYTGDFIEVRGAHSSITATGNHPFWVAEGVNLDSRVESSDLGDESFITNVTGRWVDARDLQLGDVIVTKRGSSAIKALGESSGTGTVYNLSIPGLNTYAVGQSGVAVHNKGSAEEDVDEEASPEAMSDGPASTEFRREDDGGSGEPAHVTERSSDSSVTAARVAPTESGLSAGYSDDNLEFNAYLRFLDEFAAQAPHIPIHVGERITLYVRDSSGRSVPNALVTVSADNKTLADGLTHADGRFLFFPSEHGKQRSYEFDLLYQGRRETFSVDRQGRREVVFTLGQPRETMQQVPLDVLFVLDTTGSMGEEIDRLTQSIEIIHLNLTSLSTNPRVRFGMVLYKDRGDEYTTRTVGLTSDIEMFRSELQQVYASGGGDYPEDLQAALAAATNQIDWDIDGVRLAFVITDAPPQLYADQNYTYADAAHDARQNGIKFYTVGTGGMDVQGEYPLRQLSQYTGARYIFLTYGERGESAGGTVGSVSHHTGANYETDKLESIIIRFAKEELQYLTAEPIEPIEPYFTATQIPTEERDATLRKLFESAIGQLLSYSSWAIPAGTPTAVVPFHPTEDHLGVQAEYLSEQLLLTMRQGSPGADLRLVERRDLQAILEEIEFQLSGLVEESNVTRVGEFVGAELLITGSLYEAEDAFELFVRLLRVETGEVLAVTKTVIDRDLVP